jgi:hypothetical protein
VRRRPRPAGADHDFAADDPATTPLCRGRFMGRAAAAKDCRRIPPTGTVGRWSHGLVADRWPVMLLPATLCNWPTASLRPSSRLRQPQQVQRRARGGSPGVLPLAVARRIRALGTQHRPSDPRGRPGRKDAPGVSSQRGDSGREAWRCFAGLALRVYSPLMSRRRAAGRALVLFLVVSWWPDPGL